MKRKRRKQDVRRWFVLSDIHLDGKAPHASFLAALDVIEAVRPYGVALDGDLLDLAAFGRYMAEPGDQASVSPEMRQGSRYFNRVRDLVEDVVILPGNHEYRFWKALFPHKTRQSVEGLGIDLRTLWAAAGLQTERFRWVEETTTCPGLWLGRGAARTLVRHGDMQAANGKGPANLAAKMARDNPTVNVVHGHHHRGEIKWHTQLGQTRFAVANPCLARLHLYAHGGDDRWERGFTELVFWDDDRRVSARLHVAQHGQIVFDGKVYGERRRAS